MGRYMKAKEVVEIRVELKGRMGNQYLKLREFVRLRSPEIAIGFVDAEGHPVETKNVDELMELSEEEKDARDRNNERADLARTIIEATLRLFDIPVDLKEERRLKKFVGR